jgi:hypothetical protein
MKSEGIHKPINGWIGWPAAGAIVAALAGGFAAYFRLDYKSGPVSLLVCWLFGAAIFGTLYGAFFHRVRVIPGAAIGTFLGFFGGLFGVYFIVIISRAINGPLLKRDVDEVVIEAIAWAAGGAVSGLFAKVCIGPSQTSSPSTNR